MRYVSIDIETTGLDPDIRQLLQLGMVIEDTETAVAHPGWPSCCNPVEDLPTFNAVVVRDVYHGEPYALSMHADIFKAVANVPPQGVGLAAGDFEVRGRAAMADNEGRVFLAAKMWLLHYLGAGPYVAAGKNLGNFDFRFLPKSFTSLFHHRLIDAGSVAIGRDAAWWGHGFGAPPSLRDLIGREPAHDAVGDAQDVIRYLRTTYNPVETP